MAKALAEKGAVLAYARAWSRPGPDAARTNAAYSSQRAAEPPGCAPRSGAAPGALADGAPDDRMT